LIGFRKAGKRKIDSYEKTKFTARLLTFSLLLAANAMAGNSNKGTLHVDETVTVGGKQLPAGKYQVQWAGSGSHVEVRISDGKDTVAKVPAHVLPLEKAEAVSGYSTHIDQAGNKALTEGFLCWQEVSAVHWRSERLNGHTFR